MIFVPLLHYFKCKNTYSGNEYGLRYRLTPGKRSVPDPEGGEGAVKEESILTVDYWPDPWTQMCIRDSPYTCPSATEKVRSRMAGWLP